MTPDATSVILNRRIDIAENSRVKSHAAKPKQKFRTVQIKPETKTVLEVAAAITGKAEYAIIDELLLKDWGNHPAVIEALRARFGDEFAPAQTHKKEKPLT